MIADFLHELNMNFKELKEKLHSNAKIKRVFKFFVDWETVFWVLLCFWIMHSMISESCNVCATSHTYEEIEDVCVYAKTNYLDEVNKTIGIELNSFDLANINYSVAK